MTDSSKTLIAALLDRSGSMATSIQSTEDGFRELINGQRATPGQCQVTLAQFDHAYEVVYSPTDIGAVPEFVLEPRGRTALLDAAGRFITEVGEQLSALPEHERPGQVICLMMTDGMENASQTWTWEAVKALITQQREVYDWEFIFLGADIDAVEVASRMGMDSRYAMNFDKRDYLAQRAAFASTEKVINRKRMMSGHADDGFSEDDRRKAMGE
ncbi:MAG: VWA domain-containing protein [Mycobacterium sp.]|nr:VWA domain-containing protein [Mycobacterium sp.]